MAYKGKFSPKNPGKYRGDPTGIIYRSLWERKVMVYLDENINVLEWRSEEIAIPYRSPVDNRIHRYFPDFIVKVRNPDGTVRTMMLEVKPKAQTREPKIPTNKKTKRYITEVMTWGVNQAKWKSAQDFCLDKGWDFKLLTEDELGIK
jgi:hypothetical protein